MREADSSHTGNGNIHKDGLRILELSVVRWFERMTVCLNSPLTKSALDTSGLV